MDNRPPGTWTGRYNVDPATRPSLSRLPTYAPGGVLLTRPMRAGGATPIEPKNGASFNVMPLPKSAVPAFSFTRISLTPPYGKSSGRVPPPGRNPVTPNG